MQQDKVLNMREIIESEVILTSLAEQSKHWFPGSQQSPGPAMLRHRFRRVRKGAGPRAGDEPRNHFDRNRFLGRLQPSGLGAALGQQVWPLVVAQKRPSCAGMAHTVGEEAPRSQAASAVPSAAHRRNQPEASGVRDTGRDGSYLLPLLTARLGIPGARFRAGHRIEGQPAAVANLHSAHSHIEEPRRAFSPLLPHMLVPRVGAGASALPTARLGTFVRVFRRRPARCL